MGAEVIKAHDRLFKKVTKVKISVLYEHKSYKPDNEYLQLLRYMLSIWEFQTTNKEELSIVIPVIFYHGKGKWKHKSFFDHLNCTDKGLQKFIPDFSYILTDLREYSDSQLIEEVFKSNINKVIRCNYEFYSVYLLYDGDGK